VPKARLIRILVACTLGLVLAAGIAWWTVEGGRQSNTAAGDAGPPPVVGSDTVGGPYTLTAHTGETVTEASWGDDWQLIYFGFTFCPDVCPTSLSDMAAALDLMAPEAAARVQPLLISIDPERDTADQLASYVPLFHPRLIGLTGTEAQVAEVAREFRVYYQKVRQEDADYYLMDHSSFFYLVSPDGEEVTIFPHGTTPETMAETIEARLATVPAS
jgi:protein SCO1/2